MQHSYLHFWHIETPIPFLHLPKDIHTWVNDALMTIFFFLVGMEIKRELTIGELASIKKSMLPAFAAIGGMVIPALIFWAFNGNTIYANGWGIPMATDIAFSLGVLSLLGKKVPIQLKIFLAALAIIDDLGAVMTIALFYTSQLNFMFLLGAIATLGGVWVLNLLKIRRVIYYFIPALILWYCLFNSGVHATISGVLMAFTLPLSKLEKLEHILYKPVNFLIMPIFALANTAIVFPSEFQSALTSTVSFGVIAGLFIGKPLGIFLFSFFAIKTGIASLPSKTNFKHLLGIGILGGIGFTMSIFTTSLAYSNEDIQVITKVAIIGASLLASVTGYFYLQSTTNTSGMQPEVIEKHHPEKKKKEYFDKNQPAIG